MRMYNCTCVALQIVGISKSWALHIIVCRSGNLYAIICNAHDFGAHDLQHGDFQDRGHFLCSYCTTITFMLAWRIIFVILLYPSYRTTHVPRLKFENWVTFRDENAGDGASWRRITGPREGILIPATRQSIQLFSSSALKQGSRPAILVNRLSHCFSVLCIRTR